MPSQRHPAQRFLREVVVALDARGTGDHALRAGAWLAELGQGRLTVVHAVGSSHANWTWTDDPRATARHSGLLEQAWRSTVGHVESILGPKLPGAMRAEDAVTVSAGRPAEVVLAEARRRDADVIALGFDRDRARLEFGSTARRILAGAPKAVWVQKHPFVPVRRICVPLDLSENSLLALSSARELARAVGGRIEALHAFPRTGYVVSTWPDYPDMGALIAIDEIRDAERRAFQQRMREFDWQGVEHTARFVEGDPVQAILDAENEKDLIVMGTHGRSGLAGALLGSVTWSVLRRARVPVLAVRHPERELPHGA